MPASIKKWLGLIGVMILTLGLASCANSQKGQGEMPTKPIEEVLKTHTASSMSIPGVVGTAQSLCGGKVVVMTSELEKRLPKNLASVDREPSPGLTQEFQDDIDVLERIGYSEW